MTYSIKPKALQLHSAVDYAARHFIFIFISALRHKIYPNLVHIGEESRSYLLQFEIAQTSELKNCGAYRYEGGAPRTRPPSAPLTMVSQLYLNLFTHLGVQKRKLLTAASLCRPYYDPCYD